uniref:beta-N-acetylhexosaminidase n=1 Tax=Caenorhabditis tropicalis TaxID=1561998 RepID=A0A1I7TM51_9PELO
MLRGFFGRRSRSVWTRLTYLCIVTIIFLFATSQFKTTTTHARFVPEPAQPIHSNNIPTDPRIHPNLEPPKQNQDSEQSDPRRVDSPDTLKIPKHNANWATRKVTQQPKQTKPVQDIVIHGEKYPKLTPDGKLIPQRRIIHLDLKGAAYKPEYFTELFAFLNRLQATGILLEWEDMFPFKGRLAGAVNRNAYNMETVENILKEAQKHHLQIIPLVQTMGHLEWILKLESFAHLREDARFPQVICFSDDDAWSLIEEMIEEVAEVHKKYGMPYFHIGADEAFQIGICNASVSRLQKEYTRERLMLWHISRTARFVKEKYPDTQVLAWHDMLASAMETDIAEYKLTELLQPVLWNYAEDLDIYLPRSTWMILKSFGSVWGSSAWKGADGPARYATNANHYVKNHESWVKQLSMVYKDFNVVEGLIMTGWSRYDHFAVLAETIPVALPTLAMSMETMLEGRPLVGNYPVTAELLQCTPPLDLGFTASGCRFPGSRIYELINEMYQKQMQLRTYRQDDYELNGWLSRVADEYSVSSHWYIDKIEQLIEMHAGPLEQISESLRFEMEKIFFKDTVDEFLFTYLGEDLEWLNKKRETIKKVSATKTFPKRPFVDSATSKMVSTSCS